MAIYSIILAAGEGKRMKSKTAKPLHKVSGKPMLGCVLDAATEANTDKNIVVIGHRKEEIQEYFGDSVLYAVQERQLGTGDAVIQGTKQIADEEGIVMVLCGDTPLITAETLKKALAEQTENNNAVTVITAIAPNPFGYGRIVRSEDGSLKKIVEQKDATEEEQKITEINSGMYFFDIKHLRVALSKLNNNNSQGEYYLTDTIEYLINNGEKAGSVLADFYETLGVNDRVQLAAAEKIQNQRNVKKAMLDGVTIIDPDNTYIESSVKIGMDTVIYPGTTLKGDCKIGEDCTLGPNTIIEDCEIEDSSSVVCSRLVESKVGKNVNIGPFAYLRPNSRLADNVKIGDFVEVKNSFIDEGTKVSHLTYIGDADVGKKVNFGCGTVIVNYDGTKKHRTTICDNAFIGCNTNLVSPVTVNEGAYTAAGSTITKDVPEGALAIARSRQENKENWTKYRK